MNWERLAPFRTALLCILGFVCIATAAFLFNVIVGFLTTGVLCLALEYLTQPERRARQ